MAEFKPTKPDYIVSALDKANDSIRGNIGAGWNTRDGQIRIKLNSFVVLDTTKHDLVIPLFPSGGVAPSRPKAKQRDDDNDASALVPGEDIPF